MRRVSSGTKLLGLLLAGWGWAAHAQTGAVNGYCTVGGVKVVTQGMNSTNTVQASYPKCTVAVYLTGTVTPATIYSDGVNTPLSSIFTANANGSWLFYVATGVGVDVVMSGGVAPNTFPSPVTLTDIMLGGGGGGGGGGTVTSASVATANGFQGTVANATTTPAISVSVDSSHVLPVNTGAATSYLNQAGVYSVPPGGVSQIVPGANITVTPSSGLGAVTVSATGAPLTATAMQTATATLTGCTTAGLPWNPATNTCTGGGSTLPTATAPGQIPTSTAAGATYVVQPQIFYSQSGDTIASIEAQCSTACTYVVTVPQTFTLAASHALSANVALDFKAGGLWTVNGAYTLTMGPVTGTLTQHFGGTSTIAGLTGAVPVEWFGAVGFTTKAASAAGTDYTAQIQRTLNSISVGPGWAQLQGLCYNTSSGLSITTSSLGIQGVGGRDTIPSLMPNCVSTLVSTATTGTVLNVQGSSFGAPILWNDFKRFAIQRTGQCASTTPTTCIGFRFQYAYGIGAEDLTSDDSLDGFYFNGDPYAGRGHFRDISCQNGQSGPNTYVSGQAINCFDIDSDNGTPMDTTWFENVTMSPANTAMAAGVITTAVTIHGTQINDLNFYGLTSSQSSYGMVVNYTGTGVLDSCADIHVNFPTFDAITVSAFKITGLAAPCIGSFIGLGGYATGNNTGNSGQKIIDIENSYGVQFVNLQLFAGNGGQTAVYANNSSNLSLSGLKCQWMRNNTVTPVPANCIQLNNTTSSVVSGNTMDAYSSQYQLATAISLTSGSIGNSITGNVVSGFVTKAYGEDSTSQNNAFAFGGNTCFGTNITTCSSGMGLLISALPAATSVTIGTQFVVNDATTYTPGACTGGGSDTMIAISNGTTWSCH